MIRYSYIFVGDEADLVVSAMTRLQEIASDVTLARDIRVEALDTLVATMDGFETHPTVQ